MRKKNHQRPNVSVVIPSYNGLKLLKKHLKFNIKQLIAGDQIIIVDDASQDSTVNWLREQFGLERISTNTIPNVDHYQSSIKLEKGKISFDLIINHKNLRFGETVNIGFKAASESLVFLINNDVRTQADTLHHLSSYFIDDLNSHSESVFAVGCLEREEKVNGKQQEGGKNKLWFERGLFQHSRANNFSSGPTGWVSGGSGMFSRDKWSQLSGFDSLFYPAYWEDIDLSFRAKQRGWLVLFEEKSVVDHLHETTNQTVFGQGKIQQMSWKNADSFTWKNGSLVQKISYLCWRPFWWWKRYQTLQNVL
jgi:GT2 family glycosyltransferase